MRTKYNATASHTAFHVTPVTNARRGRKCNKMNGIEDFRLMCSFGAHVDGSRLLIGAAGTAGAAMLPGSTVTDMDAPDADEWDRRLIGRRSTDVWSPARSPFPTGR